MDNQEPIRRLKEALAVLNLPICSDAVGELTDEAGNVVAASWACKVGAARYLVRTALERIAQCGSASSQS